MRIVYCSQECDIPSTINPLIDTLLERWDAVVLNPYMGVSEWASYGNRVYFDVSRVGDLFTEDGRRLWVVAGDLAAASGLGIVVTREMLSVAQHRWPITPICPQDEVFCLNL